MPEAGRRAAGRGRALAESGAAAVGLCLFALLAHRAGLLRAVSLLGLSVAACAIALALGRARSPLDVMGFSRWTRGLAAWAAAALLLGIGLGVGHRVGYGHGFFPSAIEPFAFLAAAIGATEELTYRGWMQGVLRPWGAALSVVLAAAAHTAYKTALFALPPAPAPVNILFLVGATFVGGLALGALRAGSRSVLPPLVLHVAFDLVVYGDRGQAPWWVWS